MNTIQNINEIPEWVRMQISKEDLNHVDADNAENAMRLLHALRMPFKALHTTSGRVVAKVLEVKQATVSGIDVNFNLDPSNRYRFAQVASVAGEISKDISPGDIIVTTDMTGFAFLPVKAVPSNPAEPLYILDAFNVYAVMLVHPQLYIENLMETESDLRKKEEPVDLHKKILF